MASSSNVSYHMSHSDSGDEDYPINIHSHPYCYNHPNTAPAMSNQVPYIKQMADSSQVPKETLPPQALQPMLVDSSQQVPEAAPLPPPFQPILAHSSQELPVAASLAQSIQVLQDIKDQAHLVNNRMVKAMDVGGFKYVVKTASLGRKYPFIYDLEQLCRQIEDVDSQQWRSLFHQKEREEYVSSNWDNTTNALMNLCYTMKNLARDHPNRARKVKKEMLELLDRTTTGMEKLVEGVRSYTGEVTTLNGARYGKSIHLITQIKGCGTEWKEL